MLINAGSSSLNAYQRLSSNSATAGQPLEKLQSGTRSEQTADADNAAALKLRDTLTVNSASNASAVVHISPEAMALSRNAEIASTASATGFSNAQPSQAAGAVQSAADTASASQPQRATLRGLGQPADATPSRGTATLSASNTQNQARNAAEVADRANEQAGSSASLTKAQILNQVGAAMLAQANATPQTQR